MSHQLRRSCSQSTMTNSESGSSRPENVITCDDGPVMRCSRSRWPSGEVLHKTISRRCRSPKKGKTRIASVRLRGTVRKRISAAGEEQHLAPERDLAE